MIKIMVTAMELVDDNALQVWSAQCNKIMGLCNAKMMTMTKMVTMTTHHRPGQLNAVRFPHLESLAKVDYLDVVFLLQKIFFKKIPLMSSIEEGKIKCSIEPPPKELSSRFQITLLQNRMLYGLTSRWAI